jgi:hypothetical protein
MLHKTLSAIVAVALSTSVAVAASTRVDPGLAAFQRFNGGPPTFPQPSPAEKEKLKKAAEPAKRASETTAALRAQEEANLMRRLEVCDRLKQIALEQGDSKLEEEAIRLEKRAEDVYKQRTQPKSAKSATEPEVRK